jgi:hypothetical protein
MGRLSETISFCFAFVVVPKEMYNKIVPKVFTFLKNFDILIVPNETFVKFGIKRDIREAVCL